MATTTNQSISDYFFKNNNSLLQFHKTTDLTEQIAELEYGFQAIAPNGWVSKIRNEKKSFKNFLKNFWKFFENFLKFSKIF